MTIIAYRDGVMAADGMMQIGGVKSPCIKVAKRKGYLFGASGNNCPPLADIIDAFFDLDEDARKLMKVFSFEALVVTPQGEMQLWNEHLTFEPLLTPFYAIGSGGEGGMCAMEMGASAAQAVKVASKWIAGVGGRISTRRLGK